MCGRRSCATGEVGEGGERTVRSSSQKSTQSSAMSMEGKE